MRRCGIVRPHRHSWILGAVIVLGLSRTASAQPSAPETVPEGTPEAPPAAEAPPPALPAPPPPVNAPPPPPPVSEPTPKEVAAAPAEESAPEAEEPMSEGRLLVSAYHAGFQWGIAPGVIFSDGEAGFALGLNFGYGIDTRHVIIVPGVRLAGYFLDPKVFTGIPALKLVFPLDRFAPFVEGGAGVGYITDPSKTGAALLGGVGFMIHFRPVAFGAEASYQTITGTKFHGFGVGPILALGF